MNCERALRARSVATKLIRYESQPWSSLHAAGASRRCYAAPFDHGGRKPCSVSRRWSSARCGAGNHRIPAQSFTNRTVTLTVGHAPGGDADTLARFVAQKLTESIGRSVIVENRAGGGGNIAAQHMTGANPDGYTIHPSTGGPLSVAPHMVGNLSYDPRRDLAPLTMGVLFPNVLVMGPAVPVKNLAEFVAGKAEAGHLELRIGRQRRRRAPRRRALQAARREDNRRVAAYSESTPSWLAARRIMVGVKRAPIPDCRNDTFP